VTRGEKKRGKRNAKKNRYGKKKKGRGRGFIRGVCKTEQKVKKAGKKTVWGGNTTLETGDVEHFFMRGKGDTNTNLPKTSLRRLWSGVGNRRNGAEWQREKVGGQRLFLQCKLQVEGKW